MPTKIKLNDNMGALFPPEQWALNNIGFRCYVALNVLLPDFSHC